MLKLVNDFRTAKAGYEALPGATLLSLVATFDSYFSEIVRFFLSIHPERYTSSDRQICLKDVFSRKSLEEVIDQVIETEVNDLMRGSHAEQIKFVETNLSVSITKHYERWANFVEVFERRNLVAHGNLIINRIYMKNCEAVGLTGSDKLELGRSLKLKSGYLHRSTDILCEFGIVLIFVLWRKHVKWSDEDAFKYLNGVCYNLIVEKRYGLARKILEFALQEQEHKCSDSVFRMMMLNLANCHKKLKSEEDCKKVIDRIDWTASKDKLQICIASLKNDVDGVSKLLRSVASSGDLTAEQFREWPVFDWVRNEVKVQEAFEAVYAEPLRNQVAESVTSMKGGDGPDLGTQDRRSGSGPSGETLN